MAPLQSSPEKERRIELHNILLGLVPEGGAAYFQPKDNINLVYPCIVYEHDSTKTQHADNRPWALTRRYMATVMDRKPDSEIADNIAKLPTAVFVRSFTKDDLNHYVYNLYY